MTENILACFSCSPCILITGVTVELQALACFVADVCMWLICVHVYVYVNYSSQATEGNNTSKKHHRSTALVQYGLHVAKRYS